MKKLSRVMAGLLAVGLCAFAAGCGTDSAVGGQGSVIEKVSNAPVKADFKPLTTIQAGRKNVYAVLKVMKGAYWSEVVRGLKEGGEAAGCNVYLGGVFRETDWQTQKSLLDELKNKQADAVILAPADSVQMIPTAQELQNKKLPLILVDTPLNSDSYTSAYMTQNFDAGEKAAEEMLRLLRAGGLKGTEKATVVVKVSNLNSQNVSERVAGVSSYWTANAPANWKLEDKTLVDFGDSALSKKLGDEAIKNISDLKGIIGCNNSSTAAAAESIRESNRKNLALVGFDYAKATAAAIADTKLNAATVVQDQYGMAYNSVQAAVDAANGKKLEQNVFNDVQIVSIDNYKAYEDSLKK